MNKRSGFALVIVLWLVTMLAILMSAAIGHTRTYLLAAENRLDQARSEWAIRSCEQLVLSRYRGPSSSLQTDLVELGRGVWCRAQQHDSFERINANVTDSMGLSRVLKDDVRVASLLDWIDEDSLPRASGAEMSWYLSQHRPAPRNKPVQDIRELRLIRGFEETDHELLELLFTTRGTGRIDPTRASHEVLSSLSLLSPATAQLIASQQAAVRQVGALDELATTRGISLPPALFRDLDSRLTFSSTSRAMLIKGGVRRGDSSYERRMVVTVWLLADRIATAEVALQ